MQNVAFRTGPYRVERAAGPDAHRDQRAIVLIARGHPDKLPAEAAGQRREIPDRRNRLRVQVVKQSSAGRIRQDGQTL